MFWKLCWLIGVALNDWCLDPACAGSFVSFDDRPHRDACNKCGRSRRMLEETPEVRVRRKWKSLAPTRFTQIAGS